MASALFQQIALKEGTPTYVYDLNVLKQRLGKLKGALQDSSCTVFYAVKALSNLDVLRFFERSGCGADIVSGGELFRTLKAGFDPRQIVFSGVGKTDEEIQYALEADISVFNVESGGECRRIHEVAKKMKKKARVSFRVNPNIDAKTHPYISTGLKANKFGLDQKELATVLNELPSLSWVEPRGLSCHIGSQITDLAPLKKSWEFLLSQAMDMPFPVKTLDLGGGLGIRYTKEKEVDLAAFGSAIKVFSKKAKKKLGDSLLLGIEPGRCLVGPAGFLLSRVVEIKTRGSKKFIVVDSGMNDLMRPALYGAIHEAYGLSSQKKPISGTLVGPVCESADVFQEKFKGHVAVGDILVFKNVGAYGMSMSSQYNSRPRCAEILLDKEKWTVIRKRETFEDLIEGENT